MRTHRVTPLTLRFYSILIFSFLLIRISILSCVIVAILNTLKQFAVGHPLIVNKKCFTVHRIKYAIFVDLYLPFSSSFSYRTKWILFLVARMLTNERLLLVNSSSINRVWFASAFIPDEMKMSMSASFVVRRLSIRWAIICSSLIQWDSSRAYTREKTT